MKEVFFIHFKPLITMNFIKKIVFFLTVFLVGMSYANAQFLTLYQKNNKNTFLTLPPPTHVNLHKVLNENVYGGRGHHSILYFDNSGVLVDSVKLKSPFLCSPVYVNNTYYALMYIEDSVLNLSSLAKIGLVKLDSNYNEISQAVLDTVDFNLEFINLANNVFLNNKIYVSIVKSKYNAYGKTTFYKLDTSMAVLHSKIYNKAHVTSLYSFNNTLVVSGFMITIPLGQLQKVIMDTAFNVLNDYEIQFIEDQKCKNISVLVSLYSDNSKVIPLTTSKFLVMGNVDIVDDSATCRYKAAVACSVIDTGNTITPYFLSKPNTNLKISPLNFNTPIDYKYSKIYVAAILADTVEQDLNFDLWGMNKTPTSIVVTTLDTMGKVVWQKIVGGDMSYNPSSIVATLDSGCLVAGTRYNYKNPKVVNVVENFLLKLDKHGNVQFTSIKENSRFVTHKCYPNPTVDELYFDLPFASNYKIEFYDLYKGNVLYSNSNYANGDKISTKQFSSGMYVYKITNGTNVYAGKFVKE